MGVEGEAREIVTNADCCVPIEPENAQALADAIVKLKNDPTECKRLGNNGRKAVEEKYSRDVLADEMIKFIEELVKGDTKCHGACPE